MDATAPAYPKLTDAEYNLLVEAGSVHAYADFRNPALAALFGLPGREVVTARCRAVVEKFPELASLTDEQLSAAVAHWYRVWRGGAAIVVDIAAVRALASEGEAAPAAAEPISAADVAALASDAVAYHVPAGSEQQMWDLFRGHDRTHGASEPAGKRERDGKSETKNWTVKTGGATPALWRKHLLGEWPSLGVHMLREGAEGFEIFWAAADIDVYGQIDHAELAAKIEAAGLPLVVAASKSGGAHLYAFFSRPAHGDQVRAVVTALAHARVILGLGTGEVFPKQTELAPDGKGSWLNMPYQGATRQAYDAHGALPLDEFLTMAQFLRCDPGDFVAAVAKAAAAAQPAAKAQPEPGQRGRTRKAEDAALRAEIIAGFTPCLAKIANIGGQGEGGRNDFLYNIAVNFRLMGILTRENMRAANHMFCHPPLPDREVNDVLKSVGKGNGFFKCDQPTADGHCDKEACLRCPFGIGHGRPETAWARDLRLDAHARNLLGQAAQSGTAGKEQAMAIIDALLKPLARPKPRRPWML